MTAPDTKETLAVRYRPKSFDDLTEQTAIKLILEEQIKTNSIVNVYLFVGSAGTGKTTTARILADKVNNGEGNPFYLDAAKNNGVDDVRGIIDKAQIAPMYSKYNIFIIDECHMFSTGAWNASLHIFEEPPKHSIFILCTTDPQKIPNTVLSRVQRYDFQRISTNGIIARLKHIITEENDVPALERGGNYLQGEDYYEADEESLNYIAKRAAGGMRDAIKDLEKCFAYKKKLTIKEIIEVLGTLDYDSMFTLTDGILDNDKQQIIEIIDHIYRQGIEPKQFVKDYCCFLTDLMKLYYIEDFNFVDIPSTYEVKYTEQDAIGICKLLKKMIDLTAAIKYESNAKALIEATLLVM